LFFVIGFLLLFARLFVCCKKVFWAALRGWGGVNPEAYSVRALIVVCVLFAVVVVDVVVVVVVLCVLFAVVVRSATLSLFCCLWYAVLVAFCVRVCSFACLFVRCFFVR
jgi:hypothetical protein